MSEPPGTHAVNAFFQFSFYFASLAIITAVVSKTSLHVVPQGHVCLYFRFGMLMPRISEPGMRMRLPVVDVCEYISFRMQALPVGNLSCTTRGGTSVLFDRTEVLFQLEKSRIHETVLNYGTKYYLTMIKDKLRQEIGVLCSKLTLQELYMEKTFELPTLLQDVLTSYFAENAPGIVHLGVHISGPIIPDRLRQQFEALDEERTKVLIAQEKVKVQELELEMLKRKAVTEAEIEVEKGEIVTQRWRAQGDVTREQHALENEIFLSQEKAKAEALRIRGEAEAKVNSMKLTPEYLQLAALQALGSNSKWFLGHNWTSVLQQQGIANELFAGVKRHSEPQE
ncbi:unnamed protein product [Ostreobium quekettii]|uniref:Band 7 domain-containing protein n=1 Tax=Ostreobium quekettii TaxID=121088 RepID=A0A8S1IL09_9CHLO|nr:unnamed protein product [Ostreobium quekettii]|eukprot:evm.model.scf_3112.3 EVM.evm.TU.scf_3112.3   scf_3112:11675-15920(+)